MFPNWNFLPIFARFKITFCRANPWLRMILSFPSPCLEGTEQFQFCLKSAPTERPTGVWSTNFSCPVYWLRGGLGCKGVLARITPLSWQAGQALPSRLVARTWRCAESPSVYAVPVRQIQQVHKRGCNMEVSRASASKLDSQRHS